MRSHMKVLVYECVAFIWLLDLGTERVCVVFFFIIFCHKSLAVCGVSACDFLISSSILCYDNDVKRQCEQSLICCIFFMFWFVVFLGGILDIGVSAEYVIAIKRTSSSILSVFAKLFHCIEVFQ